ncbi:MAG: hypothetical protein GY822_19765 [Deltaproteobacteria bacterium]|nr:hypothetical protein [Deltaproteobacteria bacterium]
MSDLIETNASIDEEETLVEAAVLEPTANPPATWWQRHKAHLLALYLLFHICGVVLQAMPAVSGGMSKAAWKDPTAQAEFHQWADLARSVGIKTTDEDFEKFLWNSARTLTDTRKVVLKPWAKYLRATGAQQSWRMFVAPHRFPSRLLVEVEHFDENGKRSWQEIYRSRSDEHIFLRTKLDYHRMRKYVFLTSWRHRRAAYKDLVHYVAREAAAVFPEAKRIRVRHFTQRTRTPDEVTTGVTPKGKYKNTLTVRLDKYRKEAQNVPFKK